MQNRIFFSEQKLIWYEFCEHTLSLSFNIGLNKNELSLEKLDAFFCLGRDKIDGNAWIDIYEKKSNIFLEGTVVLGSIEEIKILRVLLVDIDTNEKFFLDLPDKSLKTIKNAIVSVETEEENLVKVLIWSEQQDCDLQTSPLGKKYSKALSVRKLNSWKGYFSKHIVCRAEGDNKLFINNPSNESIDFNRLDKIFSIGKGLHELHQFKDKHLGEEAWLVGNGPSVRYEDLAMLKGKLTFGFNRLYLSFNHTDFRPTYTVSGDQQVIHDFGGELCNEAESEVFLASEERPNMEEKFSWLRQIQVFPSVFSFDVDKYVTPGGSSVYVAMQLAFYMGIRRIYLYGMDFDFKLNRNYRTQEKELRILDDSNHFIENYRSGKVWVPPSYRNITSSFFAARNLFEANGGSIKNASHGGKLNIFERIGIKSALLESSLVKKHL